MNLGTQRLVGAITTAFIAAAMVASAAQAGPDEGGGLPGVGSATSVQSDRPDNRPGLLGVGSTLTAVAEQPAVRPDDRTGVRGPGLTPPVTLSYPASDDGGFEWGGEEIATGVAVFMALLAAAALLTSHRRERAIRY
jgi:hypothetical protein